MMLKIRTEQIPKRVFTPREVAYAYGISEGTLANWRSKKIGPRYYKAGRRKVIYFQSDLDSWAKHEPVLTRDCVEAR